MVTTLLAAVALEDLLTLPSSEIADAPRAVWAVRDESCSGFRPRGAAAAAARARRAPEAPTAWTSGSWDAEICILGSLAGSGDVLARLERGQTGLEAARSPDLHFAFQWLRFFREKFPEPQPAAAAASFLRGPIGDAPARADGRCGREASGEWGRHVAPPHSSRAKEPARL